MRVERIAISLRVEVLVDAIFFSCTSVPAAFLRISDRLATQTSHAISLCPRLRAVPRERQGRSGLAEAKGPC